MLLARVKRGLNHKIKSMNYIIVLLFGMCIGALLVIVGFLSKKLK